MSYLPTYTATAWYHKKLGADLQRESLEQVVQQARTYAFGDYMTALAKGNTLSQSRAGGRRAADRATHRRVAAIRL